MKPQEFGPYLAEQRKQRSLTQTVLARRLHVSTAAVSKWERGVCLPELDKLKDIAELLDISLAELLTCGMLPGEAEEPLPEEDGITLTATISGHLTIHQGKSISLGLELHWS